MIGNSLEACSIEATLDHFHGSKRRCAELLGERLETVFNQLYEYNDCSGIVLLSVV